MSPSNLVDTGDLNIRHSDLTLAGHSQMVGVWHWVNPDKYFCENGQIQSNPHGKSHCENA